VSTTYEPKTETKYFIDQHDVENWLQEQYGVPHFNVASDLEENSSPDGSYSLQITGEVSEYYQENLNEFFTQVEEQKTDDNDTPYVAPDTRFMTKPLMYKLAADGHIPTGNYVIQFSF